MQGETPQPVALARCLTVPSHRRCEAPWPFYINTLVWSITASAEPAPGSTWRGKQAGEPLMPTCAPGWHLQRSLCRLGVIKGLQGLVTHADTTLLLASWLCATVCHQKDKPKRLHNHHIGQKDSTTLTFEKLPELRKGSSCSSSPSKAEAA